MDTLFTHQGQVDDGLRDVTGIFPKPFDNFSLHAVHHGGPVPGALSGSRMQDSRERAPTSTRASGSRSTETMEMDETDSRNFLPVILLRALPCTRKFLPGSLHGCRRRTSGDGSRCANESRAAANLNVFRAGDSGDLPFLSVIVRDHDPKNRPSF